MLPANARYPDRLCNACADRAVAPDGRPLAFRNESFSGGFEARYADDGSPYSSHLCLVDGRRCHANEDYWGGIVIRPEMRA